MKIGLGTVQFGVDYGISNLGGQTPPEEVEKILDVARSFGINTIDTAALYGNCEELLGRLLPVGHNFKLVTKTIRFDAGTISPADAARLEESLRNSFVKLNCTSVYGVLIHNAGDLLAKGGELLLERLAVLKRQGLTLKIGVSAYSADQVEDIMQRYEIDMIQLPVNVLDQRLIAGGRLAALKARGVEVHARSAFLQGLLLMEPRSLPKYFDTVRPHLERYRDFLREHGLTPLQAALGFVCGIEEVDVVVCGVNDHLQLREICDGYEALPRELFEPFALTDSSVLDPSKWTG